MTTTSRQAESSANAMLGTLLQEMMRGATVRYENTQVIEGHPGLRPDIIITDSQRSPVVVEAEYLPARSVERESLDRLGLPVVGDTRVIEAAIALRYPSDIANASDLDGAIRSARLEYAVFYEEDETRFPASGWISGGVSDLADLIRLVSVSQSAVDKATDILEKGIDSAVAVLNDMSRLRPAITYNIARLMGEDRDLLSIRRMACAIIANALIFHERIAGMHTEVKPLNLLWKSAEDNPQDKVTAAWDDILQINYWAIFAIARDIVNQLPTYDAAQILDRLRDTARIVNSGGAIFAHNLTGRIFHRLIADREYLATYYTLPESAALLARLAVAKIDGVDWANADAIGKLRVGDFACGTGALLSAVYEQIANRHENAGGDPSALHSVMMEEALYGCDVVSSAIHITSSTLSGMQPDMPYGNSQLYTLPYGRQPDGSVNIGSLELLQSSSTKTLFNTNNPAKRTGGTGEETAIQINIDIPDGGFDIVIMNPPFTRATNHEGAHADVVNPAFAAFEASYEAQTDMGNKINRYGRGTCYHGNAGIASAFVALADRKLKPGGALALVLPLSAASGTSWQKFRQMLARDYTDLEVCSIAANKKDMSFSYDTGMAECLVVARKRRANEKSASVVKFISLTRLPDGFIQADLIAKSILNANDDARGIEDGPFGGTPLNIGTEQIGELIETPSMPYERGVGWGAVRIKDYSLTQTAYALSQSKLWLPTYHQELDLKVEQIGKVGKLGLVDRDIIGPSPGRGKPPRGPFTKIAPSPTATYPTLWNHNARKETRIVCEPDSQLHVRTGMEAKAVIAWATASRAHLNRNFTFGSQPLAVAFTEYDSIGGSSWPNVVFDNKRFDYAFTVWGNSTLGLLSYWWHSSRQQSSKANITIRAAESLPILDLRALTDAQLATAHTIFDEFRGLELQPAYLADADPNRALLDRRVLCDMLGFDDAVYRGVRMLAAKWCAEPSVHGGKPRPAGAGLVV